MSPSDALSSRGARRLLHRAGKSLMKSHRLGALPSQKLGALSQHIRFRPWFLVLTCLVMFVLAFLGFTNFSHALPLNDKLLHFLCFMVATGVFYFIFDVEEEARRIWIWRHAGQIMTGFFCFFCGGILSEFVQSMLPYKEFQFGDIVANLCGASVGLYLSYHLEKYYRHRREIARLYRPLDTSQSDLEDDDDELVGDQLLPTHTQSTKPGKGSVALQDVWDEREELFGIGDSDEEDDRTPRVSSSRAGPPPAKTSI
ncbi:hypothetical protein EV715DRAFT_286002 [Schizophyllum commune]